MCGIAGIINQEQTEKNKEVLHHMLQTMIRRGPDGEGSLVKSGVAMGMRRLSIIDLEGGWQPLYSAEGQVAVFQNGEIYNFAELKQELQTAGFVFKTNSDTEVLAHGFTAWGIEKLLQKIDGMFALAIYDQRDQQIYLARDRYGEKPLFYTQTNNYFAYSSNLTALAILPENKNQISAESLNYYLALHFVPGEQTILEEIKRLLPGHYLQLDAGSRNFQIHNYYQLPLENDKISNHEELVELIENSVKSRLIADVPVGIFLSGGLDSSIVAAVAAKTQPQIATFSMGFRESSHDESKYAQEVAETIGSQHHHFYFEQDNFLELIPKVVEGLDEPIGDQALLPMYWLAQEAKKYVTVVLSGEGADEIFGGYNYYRQFIKNQSWWRRLFNNSIDNISWKSLINNDFPITPSGFPLLTDQAQRDKLLGNSISTKKQNKWENDLISFINSAHSSLQKASVTDTSTWLVDDLLVKYDRMAMAHSLEGRAPFLQPDIMKLGLNLPDEQRLTQNQSKIFLRKTAEKWLPTSILNRKKQGFVLPMQIWVKKWLEVNGGCKSFCENKGVPGLDKHCLSEYMENNIDNDRTIFALIMLGEWYQSFNNKVDKYKL